MRTSTEPEPPEVPAHEEVAPPAIIHATQSMQKD
jgi:hypothetical protein